MLYVICGMFIYFFLEFLFAMLVHSFSQLIPEFQLLFYTHLKMLCIRRMSHLTVTVYFVRPGPIQ
jgi:hypothetical protein